MSLLARARSFARTLLFGGRAEREMEREWAFHLESRIDDLVASGLTRADAEHRARGEFGDTLRWKEEGREARGLRIIDELRQDITYAARQMMRSPGFSLVAVFTLALGIGANTVIFSIVNAALLRPLPYRDSDRLVRIWSTMVAAGQPRTPSALPDFQEWRDRNHTLFGMGAYSGWSYNLTGRERPERIRAVRLSADLWSLLDVPPMLGRVFDRGSEQWGRHTDVVLSHSFWQQRFGGEHDVLGSTVILDDEVYTIVGVMPPSFQFPDGATDLWTSMAFAPGDSPLSRNMHFVSVLGRLKPDVTMAQAQAELSVIAEEISRKVPENAGLGVTIANWRDSIVGDVRITLWLLLGAVGLVLLIACANVANLLLARASSRRTELGVRVALGAGRLRLVRQLLTESLVLAGIGAALGAALAYGVMQNLPLLTASGIPRLAEASLDEAVLAFTALLGVSTALVFGLWPAWHASAIDVGAGLRDGSRSATTGRASTHMRDVLIVAEVSSSFVLLVTAGLLIASVLRLQQVDPGFRLDHLLTMQVNLPATRYSGNERIVGFVEQLLERVKAVPGVTDAGVTSALPLVRGDWGKNLSIEGRPDPPSVAQVPLVSYRQVTPEYFATLRTALREGRLFSPSDRAPRPTVSDNRVVITGDRAPRPMVAIVNETAARRFWPDGRAVGARIRLGPPEALALPTLPKNFPGGVEGWLKLFPWLTVVGVVADFRHNGLDNEARPEVFVPFAEGGGEEATLTFFLAVRTVSDPMRQREAIEAAVHAVDPNQPVADVLPMEARLTDSMARRRYTMLVFGAFGVTAIVLALVGLYGVLAYAVAQRRREMGIRVALGAKRRDVFGLVVKQGMRLAAIGVVLGLVLAGLLSRAISSLLFGVRPVEPAIYVGTAILLLTCSALACWIPSRRAARVDPIATLRES